MIKVGSLDSAFFYLLNLCFLLWSAWFHLQEYFPFINKYLKSIIPAKYGIYLKDIIVLLLGSF